MSSTTPIWARHDALKQIVAAPDAWFAQFAKRHPADVRKFGNGNSNGTRLYRVAGVLKAIEKEVC